MVVQNRGCVHHSRRVAGIPSVVPSFEHTRKTTTTQIDADRKRIIEKKRSKREKTRRVEGKRTFFLSFFLSEEEEEEEEEEEVSKKGRWSKNACVCNCRRLKKASRVVKVIDILKRKERESI